MAGGPGRLPYERCRDTRRKFRIKLSPQFLSGRGLTLFWPLKETILNRDYMYRVNKTNWKYIIFSISSHAALIETFTAKYAGVFVQNTPSETKIRNLHP